MLPKDGMEGSSRTYFGSNRTHSRVSFIPPKWPDDPPVQGRGGSINVQSWRPSMSSRVSVYRVSVFAVVERVGTGCRPLGRYAAACWNVGTRNCYTNSALPGGRPYATGP